MNVTPTSIPEVVILEPVVFKDERGFFFESFNSRAFLNDVGEQVDFVQDNQAHSTQHVLRGLHYQILQPQGKLVRVTRGVVFDVVVDVRRSSQTFGKWVGVELSEENQRQLWVPIGFAHGYLVRSSYADVVYKATDYYAPQHERCIRWDDATLGIDWSMENKPIISSKDQEGLSFEDAEIYS